MIGILNSLSAKFSDAFSRRLGADRAIVNALLGKCWNIAALPVTLFFIFASYTSEEQGFYFTFGSIQALQVFFELGLTGIMMQFASHEMAGLSWTRDRILDGDPACRSRLASLLRFIVSYYGVIAIGAFFLLSVAGLWFFSHSGHDAGGQVVWRFPWILLALGTSVNMLCAPLWGLVEGCGKISEIYRIILKQSVISNLVFWVALLCGLKLYAPAIQTLTSAAVGIVFFKKEYGAMVRNLWAQPREGGAAISWRREIWPLQWKISLSWLSGYFIAHLINPVLFHYWGPAAAGRYGMTLRLVDSVANVAYSWITTKSAVFGRLIAGGDHEGLRKTFRQGLLGTLAVYLVLSSLLLAAVFAVGRLGMDFRGRSVSDRILDSGLMALMVINAGVFCYTLSVATLTRAEKREPFLWPSIIGGVLSCFCVLTFGVPFGVTGIVFSNFILNVFIGLPMTFYIYKKFSVRYFNN